MLTVASIITQMQGPAERGEAGGAARLAALLAPAAGGLMWRSAKNDPGASISKTTHACKPCVGIPCMEQTHHQQQQQQLRVWLHMVLHVCQNAFAHNLIPPGVAGDMALPPLLQHTTRLKLSAVGESRIE